ncbi:hypothetical protein FRC12_009427 [Ceratobasidium sp. 428]|nr:hypothetical protein FRC12_009427 [Ceratobasidium sp. 428]
MSTVATNSFPTPLIYPPPVPPREAMEEEARAGIKANRDLYQWELNDDYPPHVSKVPQGDDKSIIQIFDVQALLQTKGMILPDDEISANYFRLAPDPKAPASFDALVEHNQSQRAPPGVENNMLFRFNIGEYSDTLFMNLRAYIAAS